MHHGMHIQIIIIRLRRILQDVEIICRDLDVGSDPSKNVVSIIWLYNNIIWCLYTYKLIYNHVYISHRRIIIWFPKRLYTVYQSYYIIPTYIYYDGYVRSCVTYYYIYVKSWTLNLYIAVKYHTEGSYK